MFKLFIALLCSANSTMASFGQRFGHVLFFNINFAQAFLNLNGMCFSHRLIMLPAKQKASDQERAGQAAKWGLAAVEDMFKWETHQYEAEMEAEGLPANLSPLEAAMALAAWEEVRPLHKLSLVSVYIIL